MPHQLDNLCVTSEWGHKWVGCKHGKPRSGVNPVRICLECFEAVIQAQLSHHLTQLARHMKSQHPEFGDED